MNETLGPSENKEQLNKAVNQVAGIYLGDKLTKLLGTFTPERREENWQYATAENSLFSEKILAIKRMLSEVEKTRMPYPPALLTAVERYIGKMEDTEAWELLSTLLLARHTKTPGYIDYKHNTGDEARAIAAELGIEDGPRGEQIKTVTLDRVIEALLDGSLSLTRQTPKVEE